VGYWWRTIGYSVKCLFLLTNRQRTVKSKFQVFLFIKPLRLVNTGLLKRFVSFLTTCHTKYTWDWRICIFFLFNRTTFYIFVTYLTGALYVHPSWFHKHQHDNHVRSKLFVACQRWWFRWRFAAILINCAPSGEMHNYCTSHVIKENFENFLIHRCN
jgi:hypothetical protein